MVFWPRMQVRVYHGDVVYSSAMGTQLMLFVSGFCNGEKFSSPRRKTCKPSNRCISFNVSFPSYVSRSLISVSISCGTRPHESLIMSSSSCHGSKQNAPILLDKSMNSAIYHRDMQTYSSRRIPTKMKLGDVREGHGASLVRNWKTLSISVLAACVLGSGYLVMKLAPLVSTKSVPYSDLVVGKSGSSSTTGFQSSVV